MAPPGTAATICVDEFTLYCAAAPLNLSPVAPVRFVPVIVTSVPTLPLAGVNELIAGPPEAVTVKLEVLVAVPFGVVTEIRPVLAPFGTTAVICVAESTL